MNWIRIVLSILSIVALILMSDSIADIMGVTLADGAPAQDLFAFAAGHSSHALIKWLLRFLDKKQEDHDLS